MLYLCLLIGAILGVALFEIEGLVPGTFLGYLIYRDRSWQKSVDQLKDQVHSLRNRIKSLESHREHANITESFVVVENPSAEENAPLSQEREQSAEEAENQEEGVHNKGQEAVVEDNIPEPITNLPKPEDFEPEPMGALESIRALVLKGNWLYLSGIAVLFIGLWLAIDNQIIPIEWSLVLVASIGCMLIFIGSRLVSRRPEFGFVMEGGGLAVLYLTIFASFRLYGVLPEATATGLLMAVTMFGVLLGLAQNTQWVSVVSMLGGFLVPVLINTEQGNHVALFSYYAILNMGILATAWYKPWRYLNLTGFVCTFGVATAWGGLFYTPEFFASIQPFLALFFVIYLCIGVLFTLRHRGSIKHAVDGTLVFGLPVIVFALQASLVEPFEYGISMSCAILGLCYLGTAHWLRSRELRKSGSSHRVV